MEKPFTTPPKSVFHAQLAGVFKKQTDTDVDQLLRLVAIIMQMNNNGSDMVDLQRTVGLDQFISLVSQFDGRTVTFPTAQKIQETVILAFCYYYKEEMGMEWDEIEATLPFEISTVSYGGKIKKLSAFMQEKILDYFQGIKL